MQTLGIIGFLLLLAGWLAMFFRVRRDFPNRDVGKIGSYPSPRVFGFKLMGRSAFSLVKYYWQQYGFDVRLSLAGLGILLIAIAAIGGSK
ncbi:MAG: hypothetical protein ABIP88_11500 [Candidatus Binatia bacterium]